MNTAPHAAQREIVRREQAFPLISFVQLITFSVGLVTCIDFKVLRSHMNTIPNVGAELAVGVPVGAALIGFLIGAGVGLGQIRKWRSFMLCSSVGAVVGLLVLAALAAPASPIQAAFACALPLVSTLLLRVRTR